MTMPMAAINTGPVTATLDPVFEPIEVLPPPPLMPDEDEMLRWKHRIEKAKQQSKDNSDKYDPFVKQYKEGSLPDGISTTRDNRTFPYANILIAHLYSQNPSISVQPNQTSGSGLAQLQMIVAMGLAKDVPDARKKFAKTLERVLLYSYGQSQTETQNNSTVFQCIVPGLGYTKTSYDPITDIGLVTSLRRDEVFVDPHARCDISRAGYVMQTCIEPIEVARDMFESIGYRKTDEQGETVTLNANFKLSQSDNLTGRKAKKNDPAKQNDCFKFFECWSKDRDERWIDYFDFTNAEWIFRRPWPFRLAFNDFPYEDLAFNKQGTQINDSFSDFEVVEGICHMEEEFSEYEARHTRRSMAVKILYAADAIDDKALEALKSDADMQFVKVDNKGMPLDSVVQVLSMNDAKNDTPFELAEAMGKKRKEILGQDETEQAALNDQAEITAEHAKIVDDRLRIRMGRRQKVIDAWLTRQIKHLAQIVRQLVSAETVNKICGPDAARIWTLMAPNTDDLTHEYSISVVAGSSGERAKREKIERLMRMLDRAASTNAQVGYPALDVLAMTMDIYEAMGETGADKYLKPAPAPKTSISDITLSGSTIDGLIKMMLPPSITSPTGQVMTIPGALPLASWEEIRKMIGLPPQMNAEVGPVTPQEQAVQNAPAQASPFAMAS